MSELSARLKELRTAKKVKQDTLAAALGLSAQAISDIETGRRSTTADKLILMADFFQVSVDYLLGRTDSPQFDGRTNRYVAEALPSDLIEIFDDVDDLTREKILDYARMAHSSYRSGPTKKETADHDREIAEAFIREQREKEEAAVQRKKDKDLSKNLG